MKCKCRYCSKEEIFNFSEQHRHECESRFVASHNAEWIKEHLAGVQEKRGFDSYKRLRDDVAKLWKK